MSDASESETGRAADAARWAAFANRLRAFAARRVPAQDADDVVQDVLMRIHVGLASLRGEERADSWIYGIARRAIADYYRARHSRMRVESPRDPASAFEPQSGPNAAGTPSGSPDLHEEVLSWMRPFAEALPADYGRALIMADFEARPQREVAEALGLSLSGAKSRVQRARKMVREELARCCALHFGPDGRVAEIERRDCDC